MDELYIGKVLNGDIDAFRYFVQQYKDMAKASPTKIDWDSIKEEEDQTIASQEYACMAGECEIWLRNLMI